MRRRLDGAVEDSCTDENHCITCSDEGVPMRVTAVVGGLALCDGVEVMTELVGEVVAGDELLVHAGVALVRL
jgi:hydrogenase maturation factor